MRGLFLTALCLAVMPASASYEFLLVADSGGANPSAVHRYDPVSGAYFGSFGSGYLSGISSLCVEASTGTAYVCDSNGWSAWDYSTGLLKRQITTSYSSFIAGTLGSDGNIYLPTGSSILRLDPVSAAVTSFPYASSSIRWLTADALGNLFFGNSLDQKIYHGVVSNPGGLTAYTGAFAAGTITGTFVDSITHLSNAGQLQFYTEIDGASAGRKYTVSGTTETLGTFPSTGLTQVRAFAPAHAGVWAIGLNGSASQARFIWEGGTLGPTISLSQVSNPITAAGVVAPEPGILLGLGSGLALLVARRRARK